MASTMEVLSMNNCAFTWMPKWVSPFGDKKVYFVPRIKDQKGQEWNYIVVCCSPSYNGLWKWPSKEAKHLMKWNNHGTMCYYVPVDICEFVKPIEDIQMLDVKKKAIETQRNWYIYNHPKRWPFWLLCSEGIRNIV